MTDKVFPNGFESWHETHFEVVQAIAIEHKRDEPRGLVKDVHEDKGHGGLYELAEELTDEFEKLNEGRDWDGDFFDDVDAFLRSKLFP